MKSKQAFLHLSLILFLSHFQVIGQTYQWVNFGKSQGFEYGNDICADDSGNVYVTGQFEYSSLFENVTVNSAGQHDIYIAKYNTNGNLKWIKPAGGSDGDVGSAIGLDANRNVYVTGEYETTCKFSANDSLISGGANDIFLAKYNNNGTLQWVKGMGGSGDCRGRALGVDAAGYCYFSGAFSGTANFSGQNISSSGGNDIFLAKYTSSGNRVWVKKAGGNKDDRGRDLTLDGQGNLYLTASFTQSANFSGTIISDVSGSLYSAALAKYDTSGNLKWVRVIGGCCDTTRAYGPSVDEFGNVYFTGYFKDQVKFGAITLTGSGNTDAFIAKYDPNGNVLWAKKYAGVYEDFGNGSFTDTRHKVVYFTGMFDYRADFDTINVYSAGNRDIWVAAVNYNGQIQWLKTAGGSGRDAGYSICADTSGNIYHTGFTNDTAHFGSFSIQGYPLADMFVSKLSPLSVSEPSLAASLMNSSLINCSDVQLSWTPGNGEKRIVVARAGSAINALPVDGLTYNGGSAFGTGSELGNGNFVVYNGSGSAATITGLSSGIRYYFAVIEYNGYGAFTNYYTQSYPLSNILNNSFSVNMTASVSGICPGDSAIINATGGVSYSWTPSNGLSSVSGSSVTAKPASTTTYTVTATNANGCLASNQITINVFSLPQVNLSSLSPVCLNSQAFQLNNGTPAGGTYSGTGVSGGYFNPGSVAAGNYQITYTYADTNSCHNTASTSLLVRTLPSVSTPGFSPVCESNPSFSLSGATPAGGTWSGPGVQSGNFSAATAGQGTHSLTYTFTDLNGCTNTSSTNIQVNPNPVVSLAAIPATCSNSAPFALSGGAPAGGSYSGAGVSSGLFNPSVAGVGTHTISYTYTNASGCTAAATTAIQVQAPPSVYLSALPDICSNASPLTLSGGSPAGGVYSGNGVSQGLFNPAAVGPGSTIITYTYTVSSTCGSSYQRSINVKPAPLVYQNSFNPVCVNSSLVTLNGGSPAGGTYSGTGVSNGRFDPGIGVGTFAVNYTVIDANGCSASASQNMIVKPLPSVNLNFFNPICSNAAALQLTGGTPAGGTYSGNGVSGGYFNPSIGAGSHMITYSYTDGNSCTGTASNPIQVNPAPNVQLNSFNPVCANAAPFLLQGGSPSGGQYSGTSVSGGYFNPSVGPGFYPVQYVYTDVKGCSDSQTKSILVNSLPLVNLGPDTMVCANAVVTLDAGAGNTTVQWSDGSHGRFLQVDSSGTGFGHKFVSVLVTNSVACSASDTISILFDACAGIKTPHAEVPAVYIYPNPFSGSFRVLCERKLELRVFDVSGRLLISRDDVIGSTDLGWDLAAGTYFLEVSNSDVRKIYHLVKSN